MMHISQTPGFALVYIRFWPAYLKSCHILLKTNEKEVVKTSVPDPEVFRPPGSGSVSQRYGSGS
jgi:hypothetical protein